MTTYSATVNLSRPSRWIPKPRLKRLQSAFAAKLRKANYLSISVMRLKLAGLNWLKLTLPNPTYKAHCFPKFNIHTFHRRQDNAQWIAYIWLPWRSNSSSIFKTTKVNRDSKKTKHNWHFWAPDQKPSKAFHTYLVSRRSPKMSKDVSKVNLARTNKEA